MNKINIDSEKIILNSDSPYYLEVYDNFKLNIIVEKDIHTKLVILGKDNYEINYELLDNSSLTVNSLNKDNDVKIDVKLHFNACIYYNHSVLTKEKSINHFNIQHIKNNSKSFINNNGVNMSLGSLFFIIDGVIPQKLKNIECHQNSKIINYLNGESKIIPNLIIDSHDIIASHSAYIGKIDDEEKFYLASRGLSEKKIKYLIYKANLLGSMDLLDEEDEFNKIINEWW